MKEIANDIWNAPKEQVYSFAEHALLLYALGSLLGLILSIILFKYVKKRMGFGKEWDDKWKDFDQRFKSF